MTHTANSKCIVQAIGFGLVAFVLSGAGKLEKQVNCWNTLRASCATTQPVTANVNAKKHVDWAISLQASQEWVEGSTTSKYGPERAMNYQERLPVSANDTDDIVWTCGKPQEVGIKRPAITQRPYSGKLDNLSKHPVQEIIHKVMKVDCVETLDGAAHAQFNATNLSVQAVGGTSTTAVTFTDGVETIVNDIELGKDHIKAIVDGMKERNIPPFMNDDYYAIAWPSTLRPFKNDLEALSQYVETGFAQIMNGEIGKYEGTRFVEQTHVAKGGAVDSTTWTFRVPDAWDNAKSDWMFIMGEDTVAEAIAIPIEIRGKIPSDFGRSRGIAWYYLGGFGLVHSASGDAVNARIAKWESAS